MTQSVMPNPVDHPGHLRARQSHHEPRLRLRIKNANPSWRTTFADAVNAGIKETALRPAKGHIAIPT